MYGGVVIGASTTIAGAATIAALPNTGGSRNVVNFVATASIILGVAILVSTTIRFVAKRHYSA